MKADIFFFVTTIAVGLFAMGALLVFFYIIRLLRSCRKLIITLENKAEDIGTEAEELMERIEESFVFRLLFPKPKKRPKKKNSK